MKLFFTKYRVFGLIYMVLTFLCPLAVFAQSKLLVSGLVTDEKKEPLPGVTIKVDGANINTLTNSSGRFSITINAKTDKLIFTSIGFQNKTVLVNGRNTINVTLQEQNSTLNDVIVTGYQTVRKKDLTGAVGSFSVNKTQESNNTGIDGLLAGRIAGVAVTETSAEPGAAANVEIRGVNSISSSSAPLYVIDGVPYNPPALGNLADRNGFYTATTSNPLALINLNDIERIDVLKDASATAIYGSRGANGVILVTTKSGKAGTTQFTVNYNASIAQISRRIQMMNSQQYAQYQNEYRTFRNVPPLIVFPVDSLNLLPYYDHFKEVIRLGKTNDMNFQLTGGSVKSKYLLSGQYFNQEGIVIRSKLNRANFRFSYQSQLTDKLTLNSILTGSYSQNKGTTSSIIGSALRWAPTSPLLLPDGSYNQINDYRYNNPAFPNPAVDLTTADNNPISLADNFDNLSNQSNISANISASYAIAKNLTLLQRVGINYLSAGVQAYRPTYQPTSSGFRGRASLGTQLSESLTTETNLQYNTVIKRHNFGLLGVFTTEQNFNQDDKTGTQAFTQDNTALYGIALGNSLEIPATTYADYKIISYIGRANYNYDSKYYLTLTGRYDGTSKFADENKYGFFPSSAVSWRISKEQFFADHIKFISDMKLRASYGISGNQTGVAPYSTIASLATGSNQGTLTYYNAAFNGVQISGFAPVRLPNSDLKWERSKSTNLGLDINLFKDRVNLSVEAYLKKTDNLLLGVNLPTTSGFSTATMNVGALENRGLEFSIATVNTRGKINWSTDFNITFNRNKLLALSEGQTFRDLGATLLGAPYTRIETGKSIGQFYGFLTDGIYNDASLAAKKATFQPGVQPGDRKFLDLDGDGVLTANDRAYMGSSLPRFTGGFNNSLKYKNWSLDVFMRFSYGNKALNVIKWSSLVATNSVGNLSVDALNRWTPTNQNTNITRAGVQFTEARNIIDLMVEDASFVKIPLLSLSYAVPSKAMKKVGFNNLRVFGSVANVYTFTHYSGLDPEVNTQSGLVRGVDTGSYPQSRTYKLGVSVTF